MMKRKWLMAVAALALAVPAAAQGPERDAFEQQERERERQEREAEKRQREQEKKGREQEKLAELDELYEEAQEDLDEGRWAPAAEKFGRIAQAGGRHADGALYWKAYALNKLGHRPQALDTVQLLKKNFPQSPWLKDAAALEAEIRQSTGQPVKPENVADCELKLLAINSLMHRNAEEAVPILEKFLAGGTAGCSPKLKDKALFVLAQSESPRAREVMGRIARGQSNPDLQRKAVRYLGMFGGEESRKVLSEIYAATGDLEVKKAILHSFMVSGEKGRLLAAAKNEASAELRGDAIHWLGVMGAEEELWQLYGTESSIEVKKKILHSLAIGGRADRLLEVARTDTNRELRKQAIHGLGISGKGSAEGLKAIYAGEKDLEIRKDILHAFFISDNAKTLVEVARKETDVELKKAAIHWLSLMDDKEAIDFLMEILNKP